MSDFLDDKETKAAEALITAALHIWDHEVTEEEIASYLDGEAVLSPEDEAALRRLGERPIKKESTPEPDHAVSSDKTEELLALHRKRPTGGFSSETEQEIDRKREELRKRVAERKRRST